MASRKVHAAPDTWELDSDVDDLDSLLADLIAADIDEQATSSGQKFSSSPPSLLTRTSKELPIAIHHPDKSQYNVRAEGLIDRSRAGGPPPDPITRSMPLGADSLETKETGGRYSRGGLETETPVSKLHTSSAFENVRLAQRDGQRCNAAAGTSNYKYTGSRSIEKEIKKCDGSFELTKDMMEALIEKPVMTVKLLGKPPFRFIHDLFSEVIGRTMFGTGLYAADEIDAVSIDSKLKRMKYLQKMIHLVSIHLDTAIEISPDDIVAGRNPEKTNRFLQLLAVCATFCPDSTSTVPRALQAMQVEDTKPVEKDIEPPLDIWADASLSNKDNPSFLRSTEKDSEPPLATTYAISELEPVPLFSMDSNSESKILLDKSSKKMPIPAAVDLPEDSPSKQWWKIPKDAICDEDGSLNIPQLQDEADIWPNPDDNISESAIMESKRSLKRNNSCIPCKKKPDAATRSKVKIKDSIISAYAARKESAKKTLDAKIGSAKSIYETHKQSPVGALLADSVGNLNPISSKQSKGSYESAAMLIKGDGPKTERFISVKASFDAESQREADIEMVLMFAAASDNSFGDNLKKAEVMHALLRRKAWKWKPFTMSGVLITQLMLAFAALTTYDGPLNPPLTGLLMLFVVAAASSNKYCNTKSFFADFKTERKNMTAKRGMLCFCAYALLMGPFLLIFVIFNILADLMVGKIKDYTYGAMAKQLVSGVVTCSALSIGMRANSPLHAVQTFAGFAFISEMDEAVMYKMSFDPYGDYFPVNDKEAASKRKLTTTVLTIAIPFYAIFVFLLTISNYFCVFCLAAELAHKFVLS